MRIAVWVPDRLVVGIIGPALLLAVVELPVLVMSFSVVDPSKLWGQNQIPQGSASGGSVLAFLAFLSLVVGYRAKDTGRAIQIFIASQAIAFAASIILLFIYPVTSQAYMAITYCIVGCIQQQNEQLISVLYEYIAGFAIVIILIGFVTAVFGSFLAERVDGRRGRSTVKRRAPP